MVISEINTDRDYGAEEEGGSEENYGYDKQPWFASARAEYKEDCTAKQKSREHYTPDPGQKAVAIDSHFLTFDQTNLAGADFIDNV